MLFIGLNAIILGVERVPNNQLPFEIMVFKAPNLFLKHAPTSMLMMASNAKGVLGVTVTILPLIAMLLLAIGSVSFKVLFSYIRIAPLLFLVIESWKNIFYIRLAFISVTKCLGETESNNKVGRKV